MPLAFIPRRAHLVSALAACLVPALAASAGETAWTEVQGAKARLITGAVRDGVAEAGIEIALSPGWKTYWRYPGDSGVPPRIDWAGSQNVRAVEMTFPAPTRFDDGSGGASIGYKEGVIFPLAVTLLDPRSPGRLSLKFDFAVCEALCAPAEASFVADLALSPAAPDPRLAQMRARVPAKARLGAKEGPAIAALKLAKNGKGGDELVVEATGVGPSATLYVEGPDDRWALPLPDRAPAEQGARFTVRIEGVPKGAQVAGTPLTFTLVDGANAIETTAKVPAP